MPPCDDNEHQPRIRSVSLPQSANSNVPANRESSRSAPKGRWIWAACILLVACIAQSALWTMWWEDPTHFKMSVLFVWPAAIFALTIWWVFFSGWSMLVRLGTTVTVIAVIASALFVFRLEWDGDMVPRRAVLRSKPTGEEISRQYLKQQASVAATKTQEAPNATRVNEIPVLLAESDGDWPGFRGPHRDGIVRGSSIRRNWEKSPPREVWRHPIGRAWSSFAVVDHFAFTQEQRDENECVVAYDIETGKELWSHSDKTLLSIVDSNGGPGPHATPQFDSGKLYSLGGTGVLNCLEASTGQTLWTRNILDDAGDGKVPATNVQWGLSGSPLVVDNLVVVIPGGTAIEGKPAYDKGVAAYDKNTGDPVWAVGKHLAGYSSPRVEIIGDTRQLLIATGNGLSGHSLQTGEELWFFRHENAPNVNSSMPWRLDDQSVLFGTGYGIGTVRLDIKVEGSEWSVSKRWYSNRFRPKFNDFVVRDGCIYGLDDGTLTCVDVDNGAIKWKSGRYGYGQFLLVDDVLLMISEDGDLLLIPATPTKPEVQARMKVLESGFCWNHPTLVRGKLLLRNAVEAVCFDVSDSQ